MADARRSALRKVVVGVVALSALGFGGYVAQSGGSSSSDAPHKTLTITDALAIASRGTISPNATAAGIFMRYDKITTGAPNANHTTDIKIPSVNWGMQRSITTSAGGGRTVGPPKLSDVVVRHELDQYSVKLLQTALKGTPTSASPGVSIFYVEQTATGSLNDIVRVDLHAVVISSFDHAASSGDSPSEEISLNFTKVTFTTRIPAGTTQTVTYDLATNKVT